MARDLTTKQARVLEIIGDLTEQNHRPPTLREITRSAGYKSPRSAQLYVDSLLRKGYLHREPGSARGVRLVKTHKPGIPLLGRVPAGQPFLAEEHIEDWIFPEDWFEPGHRGDVRHFGVTVVGDSMRDAGILDGDTVVVRREDDVSDGKIAVVYIGGEATVKRICKEGTRLTLQPENPDFDPIIIQQNEGIDVRVAGPVVGVLRRYS